MPLFTTIIPVYNREDLVAATIESALAQTFTDQEIIAVDDGSKDGSMQVLEKYRDRITVISQPNRGEGAARNMGIKHARGEYLAFLDSDDLWFPWTLQTYADVIRAHRPSLMTGDSFIFSDPSQLSAGPARDELNVEVFPDYYATRGRSFWQNPSATAVRTELARRVGGFFEIKINAPDLDFLLKCGDAPTFVRIHSPRLVAYRMHPSSLMGNFDKTYAGVSYLVDKERRGEYPGGATRRPDRLRFLAAYARSFSVQCLQRQRHADGWTLFFKSLRWQIRLHRLKYLVGFPATAVKEGIRGLLARKPRSDKSPP
jgi:glycosyltransferase involved in cell wall biosynthesis